MTPLRWQLICRRERDPWHTLLIEPHDLLCQAYRARSTHLDEEDWDRVELVPIIGPRGEGRALVAFGGGQPC